MKKGASWTYDTPSQNLRKFSYIIFVQVFIRRSAGFTVRRSVMGISYSSMTEICIETSSFGRSPRNVSQF